MTESLLFLFILHLCLLLLTAKLQYPGLNKCFCITLKESKVQKNRLSRNTLQIPVKFPTVIRTIMFSWKPETSSRFLWKLVNLILTCYLVVLQETNLKVSRLPSTAWLRKNTNLLLTSPHKQYCQSAAATGTDTTTTTTTTTTTITTTTTTTTNISSDYYY